MVKGNWPVVALGDVFEIARGGSPRPIDDFITDDPGGINWIMISDASAGSKYITGTKKRIRPEGARRSREVKPGDFLLTNSMSFGKPYILQTPGCIHDGWLVLSPQRGDVDADFFYYLLGSTTIYAEFERRAAGATVKNLNIDLVRGVKIPLPPLSEQRRIAEVLDRAEALRGKRRASLAQLDALAQAIFIDMFGDPAINAKGWASAPIREVVEPVATWNPLQDASDDVFKYIDISSVDQEDKAIAEPRQLRCTEAPSRARQLVQAGDVLVSTVRPNLNAVALVPHTLDGATASTGFCVLRPKIARLKSEYLFAYVKSQTFISAMVRQATGASYPAVSDTIIHSSTLPVPPIGVQQDFARRAAVVDRSKTARRASLTECDALFASLQHRAFRGEL